jgi:hypothetical protein
MKIRNSKFKIRNSFTLIEVLVGTFLVLIVFLGIFGAYQLGLKVVGLSKNKITATAIANGQLELIRNLPYESVGTKGAELPYAQGVLDSVTTTVRNNVEYKIETQVKYVIDETDGIGAQDSCNWDYKRAEVKVSWSGRFSGEVKLVTDIAPKNKVEEIATCQTQPGGILSVSVFNSQGIMVDSPLIEVFDPQTGQKIDFATPSSGKYDFPLATSTYKVVVSKEGYNSERTYGTDEIATPEKPHPIILEGQITKISFSIDRLSSFSVETLSPWGTDYFSDSFNDSSKISELSDVTVSEGEVNLAKIPGVYFTGGITDGNLCSFPGIDGDCGQSFTMGSQIKEISQVQLYIRKTSTDTSDIYLEIREGSTIGTVLATSSIVVSADIPGSLSWITFTFQNPVTLTANTQYFLRLRSIPDSTDPLAGAKGAIYWGYIHATSAPPAYGGGDAWRYIGLNNDPSDPGQRLGPEDQYAFSFKITDDECKSSGYLISKEISPTNLISWDKFSFTDNEPAATQILYHFLYFDGENWVLIPDTDLPGNSLGFEVSPVDLSNLSPSTYSQLRLKGNLSTTDSTVSPTLYDWQVSWITSLPTPIPNVTFSLKGAKIIGTDANEEPVYKYSAALTSDPSGKVTIPNLEWDNYTFSVDPASGLDLVLTDPSPQLISLIPDTNLLVKLYLDSQNSILITVQNSETLEPVFSTSIRLYNSAFGYDKTQYTNEKGQTYFIPLSSAIYNLEISAPGYAITTNSVSVSGDVTKTIKITQIE